MTDPQSLTPRYVAITMHDDIDKAVMSIKERLAEHGYEAIIFQSSGGPAMEELAKAGMLVGVIEFIACEPSLIQNSLPLPRLVVPVCSASSKPGVGTVQSIARWLNDARSSVVVMVPTKDLSRSNAQGRTFLKQLMDSLSAKVQLITIEADVNSSRFANRVADEFLRMVGGGAPVHREGSSLA